MIRNNRRKLIALAAISLMFAGCFSYTKKTTEPAPAVAVEPVPAPSQTTTTTTTSDDNGIVQTHSTTTYTRP
jgi:PBP1b-binding outer membrane lipoprotein LpoB